MPYRLEVSPNNRAGCNGGKPCKGTKITKGDLRFGTWTKIQENESWKWRHWGCTTAKVLTNLKKECGNPDDIDGFEDLPDQLQEKVRRAWESGEIDPADIPESAKKLDGEEGEGDPSSSPQKPAKKSKKQKLEAGAEPDEDEKPPKKKRKTKVEREAENDADEEVVPKAKKRGRPKKAKAEDAADD